jgi:hypothetical protein
MVMKRTAGNATLIQSRGNILSLRNTTKHEKVCSEENPQAMPFQQTVPVNVRA